MSTSSFNLFDKKAGDNQFGNFSTGMPSPIGDAKTSSVPDFSAFAQGGPQEGGPPGTPPVGGQPAGIVPPTSAVPFTPYYRQSGTPGPVEGGVVAQANGINTLMPQDPTMTTAFFNYLQSLMGSGATPFNLQSLLPSSGTATAPGTLTAPMTDILSQLQSFYQGGTGGPAGSDQLLGMAKTGDPTNVTPAWQAMVDAQQRNIGQNAANLKEQFAFGGNLKSSPFGNAMTDYYTQTGKDQNALLGQMTQQASEAAAGRKLSAADTLQSGAQSLGTELQNLDQSSIQNLLAEFIRTRPEYAPFLNMLFGASTTYPPSIGQGVGVGGLGGGLAASGSALSGIADLAGALKDSSRGSNQQLAG